MRSLNSEFILNNELHLRLSIAAGKVRAVLDTVDPIDNRRFQKLDIYVNQDEHNDISEGVGKIMQAAYGNPGHDAKEWGQIFKTIHKFRQPREVDVEAEARGVAPVAAPAVPVVGAKSLF